RGKLLVNAQVAQTMSVDQLPLELETLLAAMPLASVRVGLEFARGVGFDAGALTLALAPALKRSLRHIACHKGASMTPRATQSVGRQ
ncbi:MAG: hypothetical protein AAB325_16145, partial [Pseudomonadota bacterium]